MKILKEGRIKLYQLEIIMSTWENMLNMNPMGNIPGVQLYRIPDYSQVEPQQSLDAFGKEKQTLMDGVFNLSDLAFDPNSRRNFGATVMPDFANDSRFHCTRDADWYITSDDNKSRFIANLMIISVTQVFKNSNTPPVAFSVEYISSKNKILLKDRQTVLVPFEKYISYSLHLAFYLPERSSSVSNHILSDLIRHCMTIALHTRMFMIPQYMGWHFNANPKYCFFAAKDIIPSSLLNVCGSEINTRVVMPIDEKYLTDLLLFNTISSAELFIILLRGASVLLSFFAQMNITPDCIFACENKTTADLISNTGFVISFPTLKEVTKQLDGALKCINDGIAVIDLSTYTESNLRPLSNIMVNDLRRMKQQPHIPVHFSVISASSPNILFDGIDLCPVKLNEDDSIRQPFDLKDRLSAMEYRIINYTASKSDEIIEMIKQKLSGMTYIPPNLEIRNNTYLILTITYELLIQMEILNPVSDFSTSVVADYLSRTLESADYMEQISDEFVTKLNDLIAEKKLHIVPRSSLHSVEDAECAVIVKKEQIYLDQYVIDKLIKPMMKSTKDHSLLFKALDAAGYLHKTNGYQCPLEVIGENSHTQTLRAYCFFNKILTPENYKAIFSPLDLENEAFILNKAGDIPPNFLPLASIAAERFAGRVVRKEDEENNHILITGLGGYGKTYALCRIAAHLAAIGHKIIAFDSTGSFSRSKIEKILTADYVKDNISFHDISCEKLPVDIFYLSDDDKEINIIADILAAGTKDLPSLQLEKLKGLLSKVKEKGDVSASTVLSALKEPDSPKPLRNRMEPLLNTLEKHSSDKSFHTWEDFFECSRNFIIISVPVVYSKERNPLFDVLLASLFNYQQTVTDQPLDFLVDELQKENISADSPLDQIIAVGRNYRMSVIAATQHYKLSGRLKAIVGNIDTKIFLKPTADSESAVLKYLSIPSLRPEYLKGMQRGDCIISGKLYDQTTNMNRHGVVLGRILDFQLSSLPGTSDQKERLQSEQAMSKEVTVDDEFSSNSYININ